MTDSNTEQQIKQILTTLEETNEMAKFMVIGCVKASGDESSRHYSTRISEDFVEAHFDGEHFVEDKGYEEKNTLSLRKVMEYFSENENEVDFPFDSDIYSLIHNITTLAATVLLNITGSFDKASDALSSANIDDDFRRDALSILKSVHIQNLEAKQNPSE